MFLVDNWRQLGAPKKAGFAIAVLCLVAAFAVGLYWTFDTPYAVLFSNLGDEDAATMTAELDKLKVPYRLNANGSAILVPADQMLRTRMKLVGKNLPLHGAVGFELFNSSDLGMTDFTQKVNYQRALQGEITRTILSVDGVQSARVLLVLPEAQVYRRTQVKPKASVSLTLKAGVSLDHEQIGGIQKLVSAAVPDIATQDVTIVDQHGIVLSANGDGADGGAATNGELDLKKRTEAYIADKVNQLLSNSFGSGKAFASVDVSLNMDRVHTTTEDIRPAVTTGAASSALQPAGVLVKERDAKSGDGGTGSGSLPPLPGGTSSSDFAPASSQREAEYRVGREVKDVMSSPGAIRRISVATVLNVPIDAAHMVQLRQLLAGAAGIAPDRGDTVSIYTMDQLPVPNAVAASDNGQTMPVDSAKSSLPLASASKLSHRDPNALWTAIGAGALLVLVFGLYVLRRPRQAPGFATAPRLTEAQRVQLQGQVRHWIATGEPITGRGSK